ncbi:MAG: calcium-translocating P-type ATPase, PMCA-type [Zavarzinella sp.]
MRTLKELSQLFPNHREQGLNNQQVTLSKEQFGSNRLTPLPQEPLWRKFLSKFDDAIIKILLGATLLKTVVDLFEAKGPYGWIGLGLVLVTFILAFALKLREWLPSLMFAVAIILVGISMTTQHPSFEGLAVMIAVVLATGVAFASEYKSDREFEILNSQKETLKAKVFRDGEIHLVPLEEVVTGDLVQLEMGDEIPADGRIVLSTELMIDQSLMTGESEPVRKLVGGEEETVEGPDQAACVYRGTQVIDGSGAMVVATVGDETMIGQIAKRLSADTGDEDESEDPTKTEEKRIQQKLTLSKEETPLQQKLSKLAQQISMVGYIAAIAIFVALLFRGIFVLDEIRFFAHDGISQAQAIRTSIGHLLDYFVYMVIIIVVAVPEGLPVSVTVSLAMAMRKMTRANSLVRQLVACETIGSATVICSDKTGTLTQNKMLVDRLGVGLSTYDRSNEWPKPAESLQSPTDWIAFNSMVNSTANLEHTSEKTLVIGNSTEGSLLQWAAEFNLHYLQTRRKHPLFYQLHFSSDRKRMSSVVGVGNHSVLLVKGAPEMVLELCTQRTDERGNVVALTDSDKNTIVQQLKDAAGKAMRTLAFAHRPLEVGTPADQDTLHEQREKLETNLIFDGFVAIRDPLRPDVRRSIDECRGAGINVIMITGDNIETANAIGKDIGLLDQEGTISITSTEFNQMTDEEVTAKLGQIRILARARPLDKYRMVRLLQEQKEVVAVTGDGTNDAPALKKADVGLAMGIAGTEVAKEASKIVLLDDSFATIVKAVHWGRALYENIQRFIQFQLTINVSALLIAFLGPFLGVTPPFTVLQLLWINVIMDTFAAIALCSEPPRAGLMKMKPKRRDESIVTGSMFVGILSTAGFFLVVMLAMLLAMKSGFLGEGSGPNPDRWAFDPLNIRQVSLFFTLYVMFQVWNEINCRSLTPDVSGFVGLFKNQVFLGILGATVIGQILIVSFGGKIFSVEPLSLLDWLLLTLAASSVLLFGEIVRRIRMKVGK